MFVLLRVSKKVKNLLEQLGQSLPHSTLGPRQRTLNTQATHGVTANTCCIAVNPSVRQIVGGSQGSGAKETQARSMIMALVTSWRAAIDSDRALGAMPLSHADPRRPIIVVNRLQLQLEAIRKRRRQLEGSFARVLLILAVPPSSNACYCRSLC